MFVKIFIGKRASSLGTYIFSILDDGYPQFSDVLLRYDLCYHQGQEGHKEGKDRDYIRYCCQNKHTYF